MRILFIETTLDGHHLPYLKALANNNEYESVVITPVISNELDVKQIVYTHIDFKAKKIREYLEWMIFIKKTAVSENIDIIHFLDGDTIMRYFGLMFSKFKQFKTIITYHHLFNGLARKISYKRMCRYTYAVVAHTDNIQQVLLNYNIKNVKHVEYPSFHVDNVETNSNEENAVPVLAALGGTRFDKGLDILIESLKTVQNDFKLIIAGKELDFKKDEIEKMIKPIREKVLLDLRFLSDDEMKYYLNCANYIVLPYRKLFNGASGLLTEGVIRKKCIIGPDHGSLNDIIQKWHIGMVFESEDQNSLSEIIDNVLLNKFIYDETALKYRDFLMPNRFQEDYKNIYFGNK